MTIRILHVMAGGDVGGAENIFLEDVLALADAANLAQAVVTRDVPHRVQALRGKNIPVYTASFSRWWPFPTRAAVKRAVAEFKPDIIQYWMGRAGQFSVSGPHVNVAWYGGYYKRAQRFATCTHHVVLTKDLHRHVIESGANDNDVSIIHTMAAFPDSVTPIDRAELDTPEDATVLLALARLHWKKGLDVLIKSLRDLPQCVAWIAGDGPLKEELHILAQEQGVADRVKFLGWRNDRERLLAACDIVAFPSRYEPFGTVMVDAWAMKKPLVVADAQGPAAYVENRKDGMLIPKDSVEAFVNAVREVMTDKALVQTLVENGWQKYQTTFSKDAFLRDSMNLYQKLVSK